MSDTISSKISPALPTKTKKIKNTAILLMHCPDQVGIVASITDFLHKNNGNVISLEQHVDRDIKHFFMRVEWELDNFLIPKEKIDDFFGTLIGNRYDMQWNLYFSERKHRMAIFVSKQSHCLYDILQRYTSQEWHIEIPLIISNHPNLEELATQFGIDYHVFPITSATKAQQESLELELLAKYNIDFIVLARYMQILSDDFVKPYTNRIINIHHSFLPAFIGAKPYHQAYKRGVKIIGATSHYVTQDLDEGPIITQDVVPVTHQYGISDLVRRGRDLEKIVLSKAIWLHLQHKILPYQNRTIIFH